MKITKARFIRIGEAVIPALFAAGFILAYSLKSQGLSTILTFGLSMAISYFLYLLTFYKKMPDPKRILPLYLLAVSTQLLHFGEEFLTKFYIRFPVEVFHATAFGTEEFVISQVSVLFLLVITGIGIFKGYKIPMIMVWFLIIMLLSVNAIQHPFYALLFKGYFPGLYTSFFGWILSPLLIIRILKK
jgi:hypothetical protein